MAKVVAVYCRHPVGVSCVVVVVVAFHNTQPGAFVLPTVLQHQSTLPATVGTVR